MDPKEIVSEFAKNIDKIAYTDSPESWKVSDKITIGWEAVLPEPPKNSSPTTLKELNYLSSLTNRLTIPQKELVELVDNEPLDLFNRTLAKNGLYFNKSTFDEVWNIALPVVKNLKWLHNRPRPDQLAPFFGIRINVVESETHHTPAYPSGHTAYAALGAHLLSSMYPECSDSFFYSIKLAGYARCVQGVHFPSDNAAGMVIAGVIWEDIKYDLFPELFSQRTG